MVFGEGYGTKRPRHDLTPSQSKTKPFFFIIYLPEYCNLSADIQQRVDSHY